MSSLDSTLPVSPDATVADESADALVARWLAGEDASPEQRDALRCAIASAPSLPLALATKALNAYPDAVLSNPALAVLVMEDPTLFEHGEARFWDAVLAATALSPAIMSSLTAACPESWLSALTRRAEFDAADAVVALRRLSQVEQYQPKHPMPFAPEHALFLCQHWDEPLFDLPPSLAAMLSKKPKDKVFRSILVRSSSLSPEEAVAFRAQYPFTYAVDKSLAARRDIPGKVLDSIARCDTASIRILIAQNPSAPSDTLHWLLSDDDPEIAASAMANPSLPRASWEPFLKRGSTRRRVALARRTDLSVAEFERLAAMGEEEIRWVVASNPSAPTVVLQRLSRDLVARVAEAARAHPNMPSATEAEREERPASTPETAPLSVVSRARQRLVGNTSGGARWEPVLEWIATGTPPLRKVPMSAADRHAINHDGLAMLGEDPSTYDGVATRLLQALLTSVGSLPMLYGTFHEQALATPSATDALAEAWMRRLQATGLTEAEALIYLCHPSLSRSGDPVSRTAWSVQHALVSSALRARWSSLSTLLASINQVRLMDWFVGDFFDRMMIRQHPMAPDAELCAAVASLYVLPSFRRAYSERYSDWTHSRFVKDFGLPFVTALRAHAPSLADDYLRRLDVTEHPSNYLPDDVRAAARAAQTAS